MPSYFDSRIKIQPRCCCRVDPHKHCKDCGADLSSPHFMGCGEKSEKKGGHLEELGVDVWKLRAMAMIWIALLIPVGILGWYMEWWLVFMASFVGTPIWLGGGFVAHGILRDIQRRIRQEALE